MTAAQSPFRECFAIVDTREIFKANIKRNLQLITSSRVESAALPITLTYAACFAFCTAGRNRVMSNAMMKIATSYSISVKLRRQNLERFIFVSSPSAKEPQFLIIDTRDQLGVSHRLAQ